jgi:glycosyltransferase involved in cell wall biosynthesis
LISIIPNGVEFSMAPAPFEIENLRATLGLTNQTEVVGFVGRLVPEKDLETLLKSWITVRQNRPLAQLLIVGDGFLRSSLQHTCDELGVSDSVRFLGSRSDIATLLHVLDVFVMSSVSEGLPMALLEAMSAKVPIVSTSVGGIPEALDNGKAGLLVAHSQPNLLATELSRLLANRELRHSLSTSAFDRFKQKYAVAGMVEKYLTLYEGKISPE